MLPVIRTARADEDLIAIWLYIAQDSPSAADRLLDAIENRWGQLALYPLSGVARDEIEPGIRTLVTGQYLTLYRHLSDKVEILRVLHGRRKIGSDALQLTQE